jgi:Uncharacterized protein conserved in bacteria (DUF2242)
MKDRSKLLLISLCVVLQVACSNNAIYPEESFAYDSLFKLRTDGDVAIACESARRSLLGEGYLIESATSEGVVGRKAYKSEGKENTFIEMNIVCAPDAAGSTVFATGVLSTYTLKMSSSAASVGLSALGSISLPIGQSADSLVKVSEETINDKEFYRRFFAAVDTILDDLKAGKTAAEPAAPASAPEPVAPEPVSTPVAPGPAVVPAASPAVVAPVIAPAAPITPSVPVPTQAAPVVSEPSPAAATPTTAPTTAPESLPAQVTPSTTPAPVPEQEAPVVEPEPEPNPAPVALPEVPTSVSEPSAAPLIEPSNGVTTVT